MTRKMATIRKIDELRLIPDADSIETAVIGGWTVVVKRGEFAVGDLAVYCEIDSWIPRCFPSDSRAASVAAIHRTMRASVFAINACTTLSVMSVATM